MAVMARFYFTPTGKRDAGKSSSATCIAAYIAGVTSNYRCITGSITFWRTSRSTDFPGIIRTIYL